MVAFDFPPSNAASVQRTLKFFEYLNEFGWTTILLTSKSKAYPLVDEGSDVTLNDNQFVYRATALDVHKHLSIQGKHLSWMKTPDRWGTWIPFAINLGKKIVKRHKPDVIWSTFPTPSANIIANSLAKYSNKPWVADYRDPAPYIHTTNGKWLDQVHKKIDNLTFKNAQKLVFATQASKELYQSHYQCHDKFEVIENGYDENNFIKAKALEASHPELFNKHKFSLYYAGGLYPNGRDPRPIFQAIASLNSHQHLSKDNFELIFQGAGDGKEFSDLLKKLEINHIVSFLKPTSFLLALVNMTRANALLLIQDSRFNLQIPGKIFEYFRTGKPLIIKTDKLGATAQLAMDNPLCHIVESQHEIEELIVKLIRKTCKITKQDKILRHSRKEKARSLDRILSNILPIKKL
ncbi:glycosyltransferase [Cognaticolwellia mytili]|uniref:glycosyltransferase n=1 Tax=Cognaticolwellia mytili TaxID=1888913 RepID=UPI001301ADE7|nr:glycosyltransferase [Cognaticolwellia mytili]